MNFWGRVKSIFNGPENALNSHGSHWDFGKSVQEQSLAAQKATKTLESLGYPIDPTGTIAGWSSGIQTSTQIACAHPSPARLSHTFVNGDKWTRCTACGQTWKGKALLDYKFHEELKKQLKKPAHTWGLEADLLQQQQVNKLPAKQVSTLAAESIRVFRDNA